MQQTLKTSITQTGIGLHTAKDVTITLKPSKVNTGIVFVRTDKDGENKIKALHGNIKDTRLCTVIANQDGASIGTIEHLMSALRGLNIDNVIVECDGPEVPIMDGSADVFVKMIQEAGIEQQGEPRRILRILREVSYEEDGKRVTLSPSDEAIFEGEIDFEQEAIGRQSGAISLLNGNFVHEISEARTFCSLDEVEIMRANKLALGGSLDNAIVVDGAKVLNEKGLRFDDEFIRHKLLDAIGDLYLAGYQILGKYTGHKGGHYMHAKLLEALFDNPFAYVIEPENNQHPTAMYQQAEAFKPETIDQA